VRRSRRCRDCETESLMSIVHSPPNSAQSDNHPLLIAASCAALATLVPVALYQLNVISDLPDPPLPVFDSERITKSKTAHPLGIPDALLGLASFGTTLTLALLARRNKTAKKLLGVKLGMDASVAAFNAVHQVAEFGKLCSWCTATALSAGVMAYAGRGSIREVVAEGTLVAERALDRKKLMAILKD
jgi:uncharacterized membrane protein